MCACLPGASADATASSAHSSECCLRGLARLSCWHAFQFLKVHPSAAEGSQEAVLKQGLHVVSLPLAAADQVGLGDAEPHHVLANDPESLLRRAPEVIDVVAHVDVHLATDHEVWNAQSLELIRYGHLSLCEPLRRNDNDDVKVPQANVLDVGVPGEELRTGTRQVPESGPGEAWELVRRRHCRRLVHAHPGSPHISGPAPPHGIDE
mmetsp:Transcript_78799/g.255297  ORF Transcript_78799/g.255297 Transcript_78799/m.255297 type:complete len:207 (+) Transcript_78799:412-1032(+)